MYENFLFLRTDSEFIPCRYLDDFKPASVVKSEQAQLTVGATQDVSITLPNVEVNDPTIGETRRSTKILRSSMNNRSRIELVVYAVWKEGSPSTFGREQLRLCSHSGFDSAINQILR